MQSLSKRKVRDEDDAEDDRKLKAGCPVSDGGSTDEKGWFDADLPGAGQQLADFSIHRLRFATESWAGLKTTNEDRHVFSTEFFPGPVFGVFDGHGGTFAADFLSRQLLKTVASAIRQNTGEKALADLRACRKLSSQENVRRDAIVEQKNLLRQQLTEVETPRLGATDPELEMLFDQLTSAISQMESEMDQIDTEEAARHEKRWKWCQEQHGHFVRAFKDAFTRVDAQILQKNQSPDGSTALLVWFLADSTSRSVRDVDARGSSELTDEGMFYTVNLGDCRAVLCRGGHAVPLTSDHKPSRPDEKKRIEKAGGFVGEIAGISRVYSAVGAGLTIQQEASTYLAVSRAFGDRSLKTPTALVSCDAEVTRFQVQEDDLFLVMACDGVWDVLSNQDVVDIALPHFQDAKAAANAIVKAAYTKRSVDNLTATVAQFGWKADALVQDALKSSKIPVDKSSASNDESNATEEEIDMFSNE